MNHSEPDHIITSDESDLSLTYIQNTSDSVNLPGSSANVSHIQHSSDQPPQPQIFTSSPIQVQEIKVKIHFIPVGNAPIMKRTKFLVAKTETFASLQARLRKLLLPDSTPSLFMYLHSCFVPSLDDTVGDLFDLYNTSQELKVHYSLQEAWG